MEPLGSDRYQLTLRIREGDKVLAETRVDSVLAADLRGGVALVSHADTQEQQEFTPSARFENWQLEGTKVVSYPAQTYGPLYFAQYTVHNGTVKLSALCAPVGQKNDEVTLELKYGDSWKVVATSPVDAVSRIAAFRLTDWQATEPVPYRFGTRSPTATSKLTPMKAVSLRHPRPTGRSNSACSAATVTTAFPIPT